MWGSWYGVLTAAVIAGMLLIVAALTAWTPLFAVGIAAVVLAGIAIYYAIRSGQEETASGREGLATPEDQPEHKPRSGGQGVGGVWGEKREA